MGNDGYGSSQFKKAVSVMDKDADFALNDAKRGIKIIDSLPFRFASRDKDELKKQRVNLVADKKTFHTIWKAVLKSNNSDVSKLDMAYDNYCMSLAKTSTLNQCWNALLDVKMYKSANEWLKYFSSWRKNIKKQITALQKDLKVLQKLLKKLKRRDAVETALQGALDIAIIAVNASFPPSFIISGLVSGVVSSAISLGSDTLLGPSAPDLLMDGSSTVIGVSSEMKILAKYSKFMRKASIAITAVDTLMEFGSDSKDVKSVEKILKQVSNSIARLDKMQKSHAGKMYALEVRVRKNLKKMKTTYKKAEDAQKSYRLLLSAAPD